MAEYIEREAAIKEAEKYGLSNGSVVGRHSGIADCIASGISRIPTADVAPVVNANWEFAEQEFMECCPIVVIKYTCSNCGELVNDIHGLPRYCPWCGAKMEGD